MNVSDRQGFTLVELAVSMVVIGILLGLGMSMVGPLMTSIKVRESKENLGAAVESVNSYASGNNRLPDTTLLPTVVRSPQDAWGRNFIYLYDANLYAAPPTKDTICGRRSTNITLTTADPVATIPNVAYVMLSQSDDANVNTTATDGSITVSRAASGTIAADIANDLVRWVTLDELRTKVGCQGAQLKIVNNELPYGYADSVYNSVAIAVDGGATPGTLRWCVEAASLFPLPTNLNFLPSLTGAIRNMSSNESCIDSTTPKTPLPESSWVLSPTLAISGTPAAGTQGAYSFTVYVRDNNDTTGNNDNIASKPFVLTINPKNN